MMFRKGRVLVLTVKPLRTLAVVVAGVCLLVTLLAGGGAIAQTSLIGTTTTVNDGPGDQTDPHVSGDFVSYTENVTGVVRIRYHDLSTGTDAVVPNNGEDDFLSDISGNRIVFVRVSGTSAIYTYVIGAASASEVAPDVAANRRNPAIGASTVAWQDNGFSTNMLETEIVVHDLVSGATTRLTNDALLDRTPAVAPNGTVVVWAKCQTNGTGCDIWKAIGAGATWVTSAVTGAEGEERDPDTNGTVIVYASTRAGETDIFWKPVAGGTEQRLSLAGVQRRPAISGSLIAFEHVNIATGSLDILVFDTASNTLFAVATSANVESLPDIWVGSDGVGHVVYTKDDAGTQNVYAFSFTIQQAVVPFAAFDAEVEITRGPLVLDDKLEVRGMFTLGAGSDGINPPNEAVSLSVGTYSRTIPPSCFTQPQPGVYKCEELLGLEVIFRLTINTSTYTFTWEDTRAETTGTVNPVTVSLTIGDDGGTTTDEAEIKSSPI